MSNEEKTSVEEQIISQRRAQLSALREKGLAFPNDFRRDALADELHQEFADLSAEQLAENPKRVAIAGRMMTRRVQGKSSFAHVQDMSGQIQFFIKRDNLADDVYENFKQWDIQESVVHDPIDDVRERVLKQVTDSNNPLNAVIEGVDDTWEISLLRFTVEMIQKSHGINVFDFKRRGLL